MWIWIPVASAVAGGLIGIFVAAGLHGPPDDAGIRSSLAEIDQRLTEFGSRIDRIEAVTPAVADHEARIAAIEERFARIETRDPASAVPELAPHLVPLWTQLEEATERVGHLEKTLSQLTIPDTTPLAAELDELAMDLAGRTDELSARVAMIETRARLGEGGDGRIAAAALLVGDLRDALADGGSFAAPLERLAGLVGNDGFLARLVERMRPYADGVETKEALAARLDGLILEGPYGRERDDWMTRTADNLQSLVSIQREGHAADDPLAAGRGLMRDGDLASAIATLQPLREEGGAGLSAWLRDARARERVSQTTAALESAVRDLLAAPPDP